MSKLIYIEPDEEITDVVDKISKVDDNSVSLVIPRGSTLGNSIVNLKLLVKRSKALKKQVSLVTNDNIAHNLASQIGLVVFESIEDAKAGSLEPEVETQRPIAKKPQAAEEIDGVKVHQYDRGDMDHEVPEEAEAERVEEEIVPDSEPEIIEAVRDADLGESENEEALEVQNRTTTPEHTKEEKADYRLIKKPMEEKPRQRENFEHLGANNNQVFGKMRTAKNRKKMIATYVSIGVALILILGAYIALPTATVTLSVASEPFSSAADIKVDKTVTSVDNENLTIPGKSVTKEDELEKPFAATGEKNIGSKAEGKVTIYNYWDDKTHEIASGSEFLSGGIKFISTSKVTVPAGKANIIPPSTYEINPPGTVEVNVESVEVGEQANINPGDFKIVSLPAIQQAKIYGKSTSKMSGGTNVLVKVVSDKDLAEAKVSTENELKQKLGDSIKEGLSENDKLLDSAAAFNKVSENLTAKSGDQVDTFKCTTKIKIDALSFSQVDFEAVLLESAKKQLASDKDIVTNNDESVKYEVGSADLSNGTFDLKGKYDGYIAKKYDVEKMKSEIKSKSNRKATTILTKYDGVLSADISQSPTFLRSLPLLTNRIKIQFNYGSTSATTGDSSSVTGGDQ